MKKHNPHTPILIREALEVEPKVWTRFGESVFSPFERRSDVGTGYGKEKSESLAGTSCSERSCHCGDANMSLSGLSDKEIEDKVTRMVRSEI